MIMMEKWAEIRRLRLSEKMAIKAIARRLGLARNTVRAALAADSPPRYERAPAGSRCDAFEPAIPHHRRFQLPDPYPRATDRAARDCRTRRTQR